MDDKILDSMIQYGHHAQELLAEHGRLDTILFAVTPHGTQVLLSPEHDNMRSVFNILKRILHAYDTTAYFLVAETRMKNEKDELIDCLNVLYVTKKQVRLLVYEYRLVNSEDQLLYIFSAPEEYEDPREVVEGDFSDYFNLLQYNGVLTRQDKEHIRQMFPSMEPSEFASFLDKKKDELN